MTITMDQIAAAQDKDLNAMAAVISATESRIGVLARKYARQLSTARSGSYTDHLEELSQVGRIAVWEALDRFKGDSEDAFYGFVYSTVEGSLLDAVRSERHHGAGVDKDAVKVFGAMLEKAGGNVLLAEKMAQTVPPKGQRLGADRAFAARASWQGTYSLDFPSPALLVDARAYEASGGNNKPNSLADVLPDPNAFGVPEDLIEASDLNAEASRVKHAVVHAILDVMSPQQSAVLRHSFGIGGATFYGHGASGDDEGMSAETGIPVKAIREARSKGLKVFAKRYIKAVATSEAEAKELEEAAASNLSRGGRK
jgi:RNA polymerase sigma factor (sigma-70 family)